MGVSIDGKVLLFSSRHGFLPAPCETGPSPSVPVHNPCLCPNTYSLGLPLLSPGGGIHVGTRKHDGHHGVSVDVGNGVSVDVGDEDDEDDEDDHDSNSHEGDDEDSSSSSSSSSSSHHSHHGMGNLTCDVRSKCPSGVPWGNPVPQWPS